GRERKGAGGGPGGKAETECPKGGRRAARGQRITVTTASAGLILPGAGLAAQAHASPAASYLSAHCSAGAHTLAPPGSHLYPDTGNGGAPRPPPPAPLAPRPQHHHVLPRPPDRL